MTGFRTKSVYKSKSPEETISLARHILSCCNISTYEKYLHQSASDTHAAEVHLADPDIEGVRIASNGKGMTKSYAIASAYGEFMERLQCGALFCQTRIEAFRQGSICFKWAPDEKLIPSEECLRDCSDIIKPLLGFSEDQFAEFCEKLAGEQLMCLPFLDVYNDRTVYLPYDGMFPLITSNGMCAGNDPAEAIAQGISELYERDALMRIYRDNTEMPRLHKDLFRETEIIRHLERLEEKGYTTDIIDCSMGLDYPVIALRVIGNEGLYLSLGGDPNPVVALERCLTEMFQLTDESLIFKRASKQSCGTRESCRNILEASFYHYQFHRSRRVGSGEKPDNIYNLSDKYSENYIWDDKDCSYDYLVSLTKKLGYHLYVRDCSYLGFPAFITLIPEISLGDYLDDASVLNIAEIFKGNATFRKSAYSEEFLPILKNLESRYVQYVRGE